MDGMYENTPRPANPRRRKRTKMDIFKESYLPVIIVGATLLFILITIIGASVQSAQRKKLDQQASVQQSTADAPQTDPKIEEAQKLIQEADALCTDYRYDDAIAKVREFSGEISEYPDLMAAFQRYCDLKANAVVWDDPSKVLNLSFQVLIVDPLRAFFNAEYGTSYNKNFITVDEFKLILEQLYDGGYVLVSTEDIVTQTASGPCAAAEDH